MILLASTHQNELAAWVKYHFWLAKSACLQMEHVSSAKMRDVYGQTDHLLEGWPVSSKLGLLVQQNVYITDLSPLGLFRVNETNYWDKLDRLTILTGWRQTIIGYIQAQPRSWTRHYLQQIQLWSERDLNLGPPDFKSGTLTTQPCCLQIPSKNWCIPLLLELMDFLLGEANLVGQCW